MISTQDMRSQLNTLTYKSDGFFIATLSFLGYGKVVYGGQRVWMLLAKHPLSRLYHSHK